MVNKNNHPGFGQPTNNTGAKKVKIKQGKVKSGYKKYLKRKK